jgi:hypothetical protein
MQHRDELNEERLDPETMASLAPSGAPRPEVEDNVVRRLHAAGVLRATDVDAGTRAFAPVRRVTRRRMRAWTAAALAAAITFFIGVQLGEVRGAASGSAGALSGSRSAQSGAADQGQRLSRAALDYIEALAAVNPDDSAARELAILSIRSAGDQIMRIAPESEVAFAMRIISPEMLASVPLNADAPGSQTNLIWY